ncbi:hypothetical protein B0A55_00553 [Friedmanniomyces simplex]|uniref:BTB domain-containing protein n=1 Tax=Friedmanniomyces simplex TaxID=329884 RepID=A0A4U0XZJ9_9PEZI|nr:hypothetical protein B0A55_00553 [Friedmanniomyces simplex]
MAAVTPPLPLPRGAGKRPAPETSLVGNKRIRSLYRPKIVSIFVGAEKQEYQVPRGLIRASSEYFDRALGDDFIEGKAGKIELAAVKPWVFECFTGWLYTQKVFWEYQEDRVGEGEGSEQPEIDRYVQTNEIDELAYGDGVNILTPRFVDGLRLLRHDRKQYFKNTLATIRYPYESNPEDGRAHMVASCELRQAREKLVAECGGGLSGGQSTQRLVTLSNAEMIDLSTWNWRWLIELYVLAHMFETRRLGNAVIELVQIKAFQTKPVECLIPTLDVCAMAFNTVPDSASLYRFLADIIIYAGRPDALSERDTYRLLPPQTLGLFFHRAIHPARSAIVKGAGETGLVKTPAAQTSGLSIRHGRKASAYA